MTCKVKTSTLQDFVDGRYDWKSLPTHDQKAMAKELLRLRECIDADLDSGYDLLRQLKDWLDAFNVMTHRPNKKV